ncbi:hypothetical protein QWY31_15150 [Cytophagales bacterium LB-30]|uniref:Uncharacterized protein n=1 Tax=Shiella aurantiaca TaxID=3058365 RepID=A0ABT8F8T8_9BACT|nr:hypothetical protein [Shiella aurantiaca]MDN4166847.1 hypothetical protein [Shiella aurantiaca]
MEKKLFTEKQINIAAFLAGPIPPGLLIYKNYQALGKEKEAYRTLAGTFLFTLVFFYIIIQIPQEIGDKIPSMVYNGLYGLIIYFLYQKYLAKEVTEAFAAGASKGSNWAVAGLTIGGLALNLALILVLSMNQPFYEGTLVAVNGNELYHDEEIATEDVQKLVDRLQEVDFFGPEYGNVVRLQAQGDAYHITVLIDQEFWNDPAIIGFLRGIKWGMEAEWERPTQLQLESVSLSGQSQYKTID